MQAKITLEYDWQGDILKATNGRKAIGVVASEVRYIIGYDKDRNGVLYRGKISKK